MSLNPDSLFATRIKTMRPSLVRELLKRANKPGIIAFAGGLPNPAFFPQESMVTASASVLRRDNADVLQYSMSEGYPGLRAWVSERYKKRFGLDIPIESILITSGSQQGLDLLGKILINPGDSIAIERPGYQGMLHALNMYQPEFAGVRLTDEGLDIADLERVIWEKHPKALFVCPNFQNPSGITYTEANRAAIAAVVRQHNMILVEDDPYSELGFDGTSGTTFRKFLGDQSVVLGSFSKIVAPGMRLGWAIAGPEIMHRLIIAKQGTDFHTSNFAQRVLHEYLVANPLDAHVAHIQKGYATQCAAMEAAIEKYFPAGTVLHRTKPKGGMFIWMTLPEEVDGVKLLDAAIDAGVTFLPGATFYTDGGGRNQIRLSYSLLDEAGIEEGIKRLAGVVVRYLDAAAVA